jgi:hypothetical protein
MHWAVVVVVVAAAAAAAVVRCRAKAGAASAEGGGGKLLGTMDKGSRQGFRLGLRFTAVLNIKTTFLL